MNDFSPRLGAFIGALKYARDPEDRVAVQTALKMLSENEPMDKIARYSGLSEERIRSLQQPK